MSPDLLSNLALFVLALLVGFEVISRIPATLHTPMMSGANAVHGVVIVGAVLIAGVADSWLGYVLVFIAAAFAAMNVVGGYAVTGRMLQMFTPKPPSPSPSASPPASPPAALSARKGSASDVKTQPISRTQRDEERDSSGVGA